MAKGHNSGDDVLSLTAQRQLKSIIERIENVEQDQADLAADKKEIYAEAKGNGYDTKILRKVVRLRKMDKAKLQEEEALIDLYQAALADPDRDDEDDMDDIA